MKIHRVILLVAGVTFLSACTDHSDITTIETTLVDSHEHHGSTATATRAASSSAIPRGSIGFVCKFSHRNNDDPIVHQGSSGASHAHDYFGAEGVGAETTPRMLETLPNTCESDSDYSSYWVPTLLADGAPITPLNMAVYLRTPPQAEPHEIETPPNGLELISVRSGWTCARTDTPTALRSQCPPSATTRLILEYPDCWNGKHLTSDDHFSHVSTSVNGHCPSSHPVMIPQFVTEVRYDLRTGTSAQLAVSSGSLTGVHGDMMLWWDQKELTRDINACIFRRVTCELTWSTGYGA